MAGDAVHSRGDAVSLSRKRQLQNIDLLDVAMRYEARRFVHGRPGRYRAKPRDFALGEWANLGEFTTAAEAISAIVRFWKGERSPRELARFVTSRVRNKKPEYIASAGGLTMKPCESQLLAESSVTGLLFGLFATRRRLTKADGEVALEAERIRRERALPFISRSGGGPNGGKVMYSATCKVGRRNLKLGPFRTEIEAVNAIDEVIEDLMKMKTKATRKKRKPAGVA